MSGLAWAQRLRAKTIFIAGFLLCALPLGLALCVIQPPGAPTDEPTHLARAAGLLHGAVLAERKLLPNPMTGAPEWVAGVKEPSWLYVAGLETLVPAAGGGGVMTPGLVEAKRAERRADFPGTSFMPCPNTAMYFPAAYVPAALGLGLGMIGGASPHHCLLLARFFMLAAFLALAVLALRVAAYGEPVLIGVLLFPQTLSLAGSVNEDGVLIAMMGLAAALLTRADGRRWAIMLLLGLFCAAKPPYLPLLLLLLLPVRAPGLARRLRAIAIVGVPVVAWAAWNAATVMVPFTAARPGRPFYHPGPLAPDDRAAWLTNDDPAANLRVLLADPVRLVTVPVNTLAGWDIGRLGGVVEPYRGDGLQVKLRLGAAYDRAMAASMAIAMLGMVMGARRAGARTLSGLDQALTCLALGGAVWAVMLSLYLSFTQVGAPTILGFIPRYFLPLIPFSLLMLPAVGRWPPRWSSLAVVPVLAMGLFSMAYVPLRALTNFYQHW